MSGDFQITRTDYETKLRSRKEAPWIPYLTRTSSGCSISSYSVFPYPSGRTAILITRMSVEITTCQQHTLATKPLRWFAELEGKPKICLCARLWHAVAQLVEALRYKPEGRGFDFRWCH